MNLRNSIFASVSALFFAATALGGNVILEKSDFASATRGFHNGKTVVLTELSDAGLAKLKGLPAMPDGKEVEIHLAGETHHLNLRVLITGKRLEIGPFSDEAARKIVAEIASSTAGT